MKFRVGVDVGGTFTDFLVSRAGSSARVYKSSTTPDNPAVGFFAGLEQAARDYDLSLQEFLDRVETIVHGTTITTNAVLTGTGARTGFLTTAGFRDAKVEAVAVSYHRSFRNPAHEQRTREILARELPGVYVSDSTEILPQIRVY
jgi:N-methylhydantoinase A/oxoprolinase/acetone carboxylase beta subunit